MTVPVTTAVEGLLDEAIAGRLLMEVGAWTPFVYGKMGKHALLSKLSGYNKAAQHAPWFVLVDLDNDFECAPPFRARHLARPSSHMCFRVAVREAEAWLLADRERFSRFLGVSARRLPREPDDVSDAKRAVVELARHSSKRTIREEIVPRPGSGLSEGPLYTSSLTAFVVETWRPSEASRASDSLRWAIHRLGQLVAGGS